MDRRTAVKMAAAMTFGGIPPRRPDQRRPPPGPGMLPAPSSGIVVARRVIVSGPGEGMFSYSPTEGFGNLVASTGIAVAGTDPYGNAYLAGDATYFGGGTVASVMQNGQFQLAEAPGPGGPWTVVMQLLPVNLRAGVPLTQLNPENAFLLGLVDAGECWVFPSGDATGATDSANLAAAYSLFTSTGAVVHLVPSAYYLSGPLAVPDNCTLDCPVASWGIPTGNYGAGGLPLQGAVVQAGSGFSGAALVTFGSAGTVQHGGQRLAGVTLSGTGAPSGTHGIYSQGFVGGVKLTDVVVWGMPGAGNGLLATNDGTAGHNPDFWQVTRCKFSDCGAWGVETLGLSDSFFTDCESTGNGTGGGWFITDGADTRWSNCRADSNGGVPGFSITLTGGENLQFANCEANLNGTGWVFAGAGTSHTYLTGCIASGNTTAVYSYAGAGQVSCENCSFSVWVALGLQNMWANSGLGPNAQYAWRGDTIEVIADITAGTVVAGTGIFTLPAPAHQQIWPIIDNTAPTAQGRLFIGTGGAGTFQQGIGAIAAGDRCVIHGFLSLTA